MSMLLVETRLLIYIFNNKQKEDYVVILQKHSDVRR